MEKYSKNFEEVFRFYFRMRKDFWFSGGDLDKEIVYNRDGVDGKRAFYIMESTGELLPTKHPNILFALLKSKASTNFHIRQYAIDKANFNMSWDELQDICEELQTPIWFQKAVFMAVKKIREQ